MKFLRFFAPTALALVLAVSFSPLTHAQALGQPCPDFSCDSGLVCKTPVGGGTPTCQTNASTCNPACSGSTPICNQNQDGTFSCIATLQGSDGSTGGVTGTTNASGGGINTAQLQGYEQTIVSIINTILVPLLVAVAFIFFLWGVFNYFIRGAAEPEKRQEGTQYILWAVVGFVVIFSVWGLVNLLMGTLNLTAGSLHPGYPTL